MVLVFLSIMNYLIDSYVIFAASVLAANAVLRSLFGAAFPLFTPYMYANLGIHWASSIPAFLALACVPFPFLFYKYGPAIRVRCKYAAEAQAFLEKMRGQAARDDSEDGEATTSSDATATEGEAAATQHHHHRDHEAELEAEAMDYSQGPEEQQPQFAPLKTHGEALHKTSTYRSTRSNRGRTYDASPYDIDRVNTNESFGAKKTRSRASSFKAKK